MIGAVRFLRQYLLSPGGAVEVVESGYVRAGRTLEATLYRPAARARRRPTWILLHGLTWTGRRHPSLVRFARAVAASGTEVFVPEVPEWRELRVAPALTTETIRTSMTRLLELPEVRADRIGVIGFSFGATQALVAAADPELGPRIAGIAAWGGYCDPHRLFHFGITGEHEIDGVAHRIAPDPYGRWIMGANYLTRIPGHEDETATAHALYALAMEAGRTGRYAWEPQFDPMKAELRAQLPAQQRGVFDLFAPPVDRGPTDMDAAARLARELADAAVTTDPLMDPRPLLDRVGGRVLIAHGRDDRLIPFTESLRLARHLHPETCGGSTITSLFAHSGGTAQQLGPIGLTREAARFAWLLHKILDLV